MKVIASFRGDYYFLSNFYNAKVVYEGIAYPSNEHAFQAAKTLDNNERRMIAKCSTPGDAKYKGRRVSLRSDWESVKTNVMKDIVYFKFAQNEELKKKLLATGDALLIEGNNWGDKIWGKVNGIGQNRLGKILMEVREKLN